MNDADELTGDKGMVNDDVVGGQILPGNQLPGTVADESNWDCGASGFQLHDYFRKRGRDQVIAD